MVDLPTSSFGLQPGYLDVNHPHDINHLVVGELGDEEVIVAACDDGDVVSFTTHSILTVVRGKGSSLSPVKAFFIQNVGHSAWGIAIHKAARLIAVSSNTKKIDVFCFALDGAICLYGEFHRHLTKKYLDSEEQDVCPDWDWAKRSRPTALDRCFNTRISLSGHGENIPNIAVFNSDLDVQGQYLASTDINNETIIWDIWTREIKVRTSVSKQNLSHQRGWGVTCLDPRTARVEGVPRIRYRVTDRRNSINLTQDSFDIADNSQYHPSYPHSGRILDTLDMMPPETALEADSEEPDNLFTEDADQQHVLPGNSASLQAAAMATNSGSESNEIDSLTEPLHHTLASPLVRIPFEDSAGTGDEVNLDEDFTHCHQKPELPFNLLQTSETDIHLLFQMFEAAASPTGWATYRLSYSNQTIHQHIHEGPDTYLLSQIERLNMILQISELGLVIVGNQVGRMIVVPTSRFEKMLTTIGVGILTMIRTLPQDEYGFKTEAILPFKSQEEKGLRPKKVLMGVAVSPVQGQQKERRILSDNGGKGYKSRNPLTASKRFRLVMVYCDHTILSYEISRPDKQVLVI